MKLKLEISLDNAAFEVEGSTKLRNGYEVAVTLEGLTDSLRHATLEVGDDWSLRDSNGNAVGKAKVTR